MKNLVKHVVSCGVGVWVSVWRKATIKLYHAETCEMMQEVNVVSPVVKMKNGEFMLAGRTSKLHRK
jgi:hypothetical protein